MRRTYASALVMRPMAFSLVCAFALVGAPEASAQHWPRLQPLDTTLAVSQPNHRVYIRLPLRDRAGKTAYALYCRGGAAPYIYEGLPDRDIIIVPPSSVCLMKARSSTSTASSRPTRQLRGSAMARYTITANLPTPDGARGSFASVVSS
jgi:hypothetical protein